MISGGLNSEAGLGLINTVSNCKEMKVMLQNLEVSKNPKTMISIIAVFMSHHTICLQKGKRFHIVGVYELALHYNHTVNTVVCCASLLMQTMQPSSSIIILTKQANPKNQIF